MATKADRVSAVIVAAGSGKRMGGVSKPLIKLGKKTLFEYVLEAFEASCVSEVAVVCSAQNEDALKEIAQNAAVSKPVFFVRGGDTRAESVFHGVRACGSNGYVCVHDCARPFVTAEIIDSVVEGARRAGASTACAPVTDTIKFVDAERGVIYTPERKHLLSIQTPQCFKKEYYLPAYALAAADGSEFTDESALMEHAGHKVEYVACDPSNVKITTRSDLTTARAIRLIKEKYNENQQL